MKIIPQTFNIKLYKTPRNKFNIPRSAITIYANSSLLLLTINNSLVFLCQLLFPQNDSQYNIILNVSHKTFIVSCETFYFTYFNGSFVGNPAFRGYLFEVDFIFFISSNILSPYSPSSNFIESFISPPNNFIAFLASFTSIS